MVYFKDRKEVEMISFEKKIPKRRIVVKNPYIFVLNEKQSGVMSPNKKLHHKRLRREHRKSIRNSLEE